MHSICKKMYRPCKAKNNVWMFKLGIKPYVEIGFKDNRMVEFGYKEVDKNQVSDMSITNKG